MRRLLPLAVASTLVVAACSGGDDAADTPSGSNEPGTEAPAATTQPTLPDVGDRCETVLDPADYLDREVPAAVRPCELPTDLVKQLIRPGSGRVAEAGDGVVFDATVIRAVDGEVVDSSWVTGRPIDIPVVGRGAAPTEGLDDGLIGVQAGELLRLDVPAELAFGDSPPGGGDGVIQAGDPLTYVIEVRVVTPLLVPEDAPLDLTLPTSVGATEVVIDDLIVGDGKVVEVGDTVIIALLIARGDNLAIFFNSWDRRSPLSIPLDASRMDDPEPVTLPGSFEGLQGARVGGRRVITMPPAAAFGDEGMPTMGLPAGTDVVVVVDILGAY